MATIFQTTFPCAFSWMKMFVEFRLKFHWSLFSPFPESNVIMMMSSNGNIFRVIGPLWGERWIPLTKAKWRGDLMFSLICAWTNGWANNLNADDLRRHRAHYDFIAMITQSIISIIRLVPYVVQLNTKSSLTCCHENNICQLLSPYVYTPGAPVIRWPSSRNPLSGRPNIRRAHV